MSQAKSDSTLSRRTIITAASGALAITALPAAAIATEPDMALQLIEAHRAAEQRSCAFTYNDADPVENRRGEQMLEDLCLEVDDLAWDLARCQPTTIAGVIAVLKYTSIDNEDGERWPNVPAEHSDNLADNNEWRCTLLANLGAALERIARTA